MRKTIDILTTASIFYVLFRFLVWLIFIFNNWLAETINFHYSDEIIWYLVWFIFPLLTSLIIAIKLKNKHIRQIGFILLPAILIGTVIGGYLNKEYWGYEFKRPTVFNELKEATTIISITDIKKQSLLDEFNIYTDSSITKEIFGRESLYYGNFDRPIMTFLDRVNNKGDLHNWNEDVNDTNKKIAQIDLISIINTIEQAKILLEPTNEHYNESGNRYTGKIIEFKTKNESVFYHIALKSGEIANDHYPFYEILINKKEPYKISKSQIFYTDFAGIEGLEYTNLAGLLEFLVLIISTIIVFSFNGINVIIKKLRFQNAIISTKILF